MANSVFFDQVVSNMDVVNTYRKLLPDQKAPQKLLSQDKSSSALIFYWGIKGSFPQLDLHNIFFSQDYQSEFDSMQAHQIPDEPTIYLYISSKMVKGDAPEGKENWFVMINVPNNQGAGLGYLDSRSAQKDTGPAIRAAGGKCGRIDRM